MSEIKMSYVESTPTVRGRGRQHDWVTILSELVNSGHHALKLECVTVNKAVSVVAALMRTTKTKAYEVILMRRGSDVYIVNKAIPAKK